MPSNRITFLGNPWPEGHPIKEFEWLARERDGQVWFDFHLQTEAYDSERSIDDDKETDYPSYWVTPTLWKAYLRCTLSSDMWRHRGFPVGLVGKVSIESINGLEVLVDSPPPEDAGEDAFGVYLLGHDAAAYHRIKFDRIPGTDKFNILWTGRLALAYVGDYEYKYEFEAQIFDVQAPQLPSA